MSDADSSNQEAPQPTRSTLDEMMAKILGVIDDKQIAAAHQRVAALRAQYPGADNEMLVDMLIRRCCIDTGLIGFATSAPALIPGVGSALALTAGLVADVRKTMEMQKELVIEIAAIYERELTPADRRNLLVLISGVDTGNKLMAKAGADLALKATSRLSSRFALHAVPVAALGTSAGVNVVTTYLVGRRTQTYVQLNPDALVDWQESLYTLSGVDARQIASLLGRAATGVGSLVGAGLNLLQGALIGVGTSTFSLVQRSQRRPLSADATSTPIPPSDHPPAT